MVVDEILLEFAKTFYFVPHQKLLLEIGAYGVVVETGSEIF